MIRSIPLGLLLAATAVLADDALTLTTDQAIGRAMTHNESVLLAGSQQASARQHLREVRSQGLPSLSANVNYTRNWLLPTFVFADQTVKIGSDNNVTGTLSLRQPLYTGGRISGGVRQASAQAESAQQQRRRTRQQISAQVRTAVFDRLLAEEILEVNRVALARARSNQREVAALRRVGQATEFDLTRARVQVSTAAADSVARRRQFEMADMALKDLIGVSLSTPVQLSASFDDAPLPPTAELPAMVETAQTSRPEAELWAATLDARRGGVAVAKSGGRPILDLVANGQMQFQNDALDQASDGGEWRRSWSTGLVLSVPLFDGRRAHALTAQAREGLRQAELQHEQAMRAIELDVRQAWLSLQEARGRLRAREGSVEQARRGLQDAESRYRAGRGRQLEVLDAQLALVEAETEHARARRDRAVSLVQLDLALGVGSPAAADEGSRIE